MRRVVWGVVVVALQLWGCSGSSGGGAPAVQLDRTALDFGLDTGSATLLGTAPVNTLQITNSGGGTLTISSVTVVQGATTFVETLPDANGNPVQTTLAADNTHPEFFTATGPDMSSLTAGATAVVQVQFLPTRPGLFTATLSIVTSAGTKTVGLTGDCITPLVSTLDAGTDFTLPPVALKQRVGDDGGLLELADGGPAYVTGYSSITIPLYDVGTANLTFGTASLDVDAGGPWALCITTSPTTFCNPGPLPSSIPREFPDGGLGLTSFPDGGVLGLATVSVFFSPAAPGSYTQTVTVPSDATNTPNLVLTVHGLATPDGG
jgi:hypothetical protein